MPTKISNDVLLNTIVPFFDSEVEICKLASLNKAHYKLFQPRLESRLIEKLLNHILSGNQKKVAKIVSINPYLLWELKGSVTDDNDRCFSGTAWGLLLWIGDIPMMNNIVDVISEHKDSVKIQKELITESQKFIKNGGITYILNNIIYKELHFNIYPLLNAYKAHIEIYHDKNVEQNHKYQYFCNVGDHQKKLPIFYRQLLCMNGEFNPCAQLSNKEFIRSLEFVNYSENKQKDIWDKNGAKKLGMTYAIMSGKNLGPHSCKGGDLMHDFRAFLELEKAIQDHLNRISDRLKESLKPKPKKKEAIKKITL